MAKNTSENICNMLKESVCNISVLIGVVSVVGLIVFCILSFQSNKAFETTESRLAQQMDAVISSNNGLDSADEKEIIKLLIQSYDSENDNLNPVLNPNMEPIVLEDILTRFKVNEDGSKWKDTQEAPEFRKEAAKTKLKTKKEGW